MPTIAPAPMTVGRSGRAVGRALPDHRSAADIGAVLDMHVAVAGDARGESDEIPDPAVVRDMGTDVALEVPADRDGRGHDALVADHRALPDRHFGADDRGRCDQPAGGDMAEPLDDLAARLRGAESDHEAVVGIELVRADHPDPEHVLAGRVRREDDFARAFGPAQPGGRIARASQKFPAHAARAEDHEAHGG
jgi:hypothetical protein